jgi:hypothetical protein
MEQLIKKYPVIVQGDSTRPLAIIESKEVIEMNGAEPVLSKNKLGWVVPIDNELHHLVHQMPIEYCGVAETIVDRRKSEEERLVMGKWRLLFNE